MMTTLSTLQVQKARDEINAQMKAARAAFIADNPDYEDVALNADDIRVVQALARKPSGELLAGDAIAASKELADLRIRYVMEGRSTATLDLLTVKTEKDVPETAKYPMAAWLPAKRYKVDGSVWRRGYQNPWVRFEVKTNSFIGAEGDFQVLRAKGLFQLMTEDEIDAFTKDLPVGFELYFKLFL